MWVNLLLVGVGGFAGAVCRYLISVAFLRYSIVFPFATLTVNVAGSFLLSLIVYGLLPPKVMGADMRLLLAIGFCGSFTTMSAFAYENIQLIELKQITKAFLYFTLNITLSFGAVLLVKWWGER